MRNVAFVVVLAVATGCAANFSGLPAPSTPVGTGLPRLDRPWARRPDPLPKSPHRRVLPATPEPGIWAADGQRAPAVVELAGVALPYPDGAEEATKVGVEYCGSTMTSEIATSGYASVALRLPRDVRECLAARLYKMCATVTEDAYNGLRKDAVFYSHEHSKNLAAIKATAESFERAKCADPAIVRATEDMAAKIGGRWKAKGDLRIQKATPR